MSPKKIINSGSHERVFRPKEIFDHTRNLYNSNVPQDPAKRAELMSKIAVNLNHAVFEKNTEKIIAKFDSNSRAVHQQNGQERWDCIAISVSKDGKNGVITANVKQRVDHPSRRIGTTYGEFGLDKALHQDVIQKVIKADPALKNTTFEAYGLKQKPTDHAGNAKPHAEMQQLACGVDKNSTMGVSKTPCAPCEKVLVQEGMGGKIGHPEGPQNDNPKNWELPKPSQMEKKFTVKEDQVVFKASLVQVNKEGVKSYLKGNVKRAFKPKANASISSVLESIVEDYDRPGGATAAGPNASAGRYEGRITKGLYARASTGDAEAHWRVAHARANGPAAGAGIHTSPFGVGAYANAEVVRAEVAVAGISVGVSLNANTGASIGVDGVSASFLGYGFSVGPSIAVRTPVVDASCCIV